MTAENVPSTIPMLLSVKENRQKLYRLLLEARERNPREAWEQAAHNVPRWAGLLPEQLTANGGTPELLAAAKVGKNAIQCNLWLEVVLRSLGSSMGDEITLMK